MNFEDFLLEAHNDIRTPSDEDQKKLLTHSLVKQHIGTEASTLTDLSKVQHHSKKMPGERVHTVSHVISGNGNHTVSFSRYDDSNYGKDFHGTNTAKDLNSAITSAHSKLKSKTDKWDKK